MVLPEYELTDARKEKAGKEWKVTVQVRNSGTGRMPVAVAAVRGERFGDDNKPKPGYRDARATVTLGAGESRTVTIVCPFDPEKVVVDPDVQVLQIRRSGAVAELR